MTVTKLESLIEQLHHSMVVTISADQNGGEREVVLVQFDGPIPGGLAVGLLDAGMVRTDGETWKKRKPGMTPERLKEIKRHPQSPVAWELIREVEQCWEATR